MAPDIGIEPMHDWLKTSCRKPLGESGINLTYSNTLPYLLKICTSNKKPIRSDRDKKPIADCEDNSQLSNKVFEYVNSLRVGFEPTTVPSMGTALPAELPRVLRVMTPVYGIDSRRSIDTIFKSTINRLYPILPSRYRCNGGSEVLVETMCTS